MKRVFLTIAIFCILGLKSVAQSTVNCHNGSVQYHFFINTIPSEFNYPIIGFVNNVNGNHESIQLGFINSVDNVEKGLPIGFLSFVKKGGYKAIEVAYSNLYPVNISFKTGIREFYTYPMLAYDWRVADDRLAFGYGIGSNIDISNNLFINPEIDWLHQLSMDFNHFTSLRCNIGVGLGNSFELVAGPSLVWHFKIDAADFHQNYTEWIPSIVSVNKLKAGFNAAIRYKF